MRHKLLRIMLDRRIASMIMLPHHRLHAHRRIDQPRKTLFLRHDEYATFE
jgi:hypothetical protein